MQRRRRPDLALLDKHRRSAAQGCSELKIQRRLPRPLLSASGSAGLAQIESEWSSQCSPARALSKQSQLPEKERVALTERLDAFENLVAKARETVKGPGGGDETFIATILYAQRIIAIEIKRLERGLK